MATYGDLQAFALVRQVGVDGERRKFTAVFNTAGTGAVVPDTAKSRGVTSIARTAVGTVEVRLPHRLRNAYARAFTVSGGFAQQAQADIVEGSALCTVKIKTAGTNTDADATGIVFGVEIEGTIY